MIIMSGSMASKKWQWLYQPLTNAEAEMLIGGFSSIGESAATFSRSSNNRGGNKIEQTFPGERSRWLSLPLNQLASQTSSFTNARAAFDAG